MLDETEKDDLSIPDTDRLFRRVPPNQLEPLGDGSLRPTSSVFKHIRLSVNIECLMVEQGRPPEDSLTGYPGHYLTSILARDVRAKGHPIVKDTEPPNDPAHGLVLGKKTGSFANAMLASHRWIVPPPPKQE
jgi:hypothetical protein